MTHMIVKQSLQIPLCIFERNINDRNLKHLFVDYPRQCLGHELKLFHSNVQCLKNQ